jgi:UPF0271 protein
MIKVFILDTGAFISGLSLEKGTFYTIQEVLEELKDDRARIRAEVGLEEGRLKIDPPSDTEEVEETARETGDIACLSETDIKVLSLGLQLKNRGLDPVIVTNDYPMQNVAARLNLGFISAAEKGIERALTWRKVCKGCDKVYPASFKGDCILCGSAVKRRIYRDPRQ